MQLIRTLGVRAFPTTARVGVCIGNFDGFHLGHQRLFDLLRGTLGDGGTSVLLTFEPHPRRVLHGVKRSAVAEREEYAQLLSFREKWLLAERFGFAALCVPHFTKEFAALSPDAFVKQVLRDTLGAAIVVVGYNWAFGKNRAGNPALLGQLGADHGVRVVTVPPVMHDGERVSSSAVRDALRAGNLIRVRALLGRSYSLIGHVLRGAQRGRTLGYPTLNLHPLLHVLPRHGVYASRVFLDGLPCPAVTNVGVRPTFEGGVPLVEAHVLEQQLPELYGHKLRVEFVQFLREERRFASADALRAQLARDCEQVRNLLEEGEA